MKFHLSIQAILFIDLASYTETTTKLNAKEFSKWQNQFDTIVKKSIVKYDGTLIKKIGDGFIIIFPTVTQSLKSAIKLQKEFFKHNNKNEDNKKTPSTPLNAKIGIHSGEVLWQENDIYGTAVNIAARIVSLTKPHQILFSATAYLSMDKSEIPFQHLGTYKVKGVAIPIRLYKVKAKNKEIKKKKTNNIKKINKNNKKNNSFLKKIKEIIKKVI